jgi:hypothetical protein
MLGAQGLWAGRDLYRAVPAMTQGLGFSSLIRRTAPFSRLLRHKGMLKTYSNWILTGQTIFSDHDDIKRKYIENVFCFHNIRIGRLALVQLRWMVEIPHRNKYLQLQHVFIDWWNPGLYIRRVNIRNATFRASKNKWLHFASSFSRSDNHKEWEYQTPSLFTPELVYPRKCGGKNV